MHKLPLTSKRNENLHKKFQRRRFHKYLTNEFEIMILMLSTGLGPNMITSSVAAINCTKIEKKT